MALVVKASIVLAVLFTFALIALIVSFNRRAAHEGATVEFENRLNSTVDIYGPRLLVDDLRPGERRNYMIVKYERERTFEARDQSAQTLALVTLSWEELADAVY